MTPHSTPKNKTADPELRQHMHMLWTRRRAGATGQCEIQTPSLRPRSMAHTAQPQGLGMCRNDASPSSCSSFTNFFSSFRMETI